MAGRSEQSGGVAGTLGAFRFIRRVAFPSGPAVVSVLCTLVLSPALVTLPSVGLSLTSSIMFAVLALILPVLAGAVLSLVLLRGDQVLDYRRLIGLELLSWLTLPVSLIVFTLWASGAGSRELWTHGIFLSVSLSLPIRFLSIFSISTHSVLRKFLSAAIVPIAFLVGYFGSASLVSYSVGVIWKPVTIVVSSIVLSAIGVSLIIMGVERAGSPTIGASPMGLFRAFLGHWLNKEPTCLENKLASVGLDGEAEIAIVAFSAKSRPHKGCIVVSNVHPGPYRDLGSGGLPSLLKTRIESEIGGVAMVPHGVSNHENNVISRNDVNTLVLEVVARYPSAYKTSTATRLVREQSGQALASAQAFGNLILITLTLAPFEMEDIPHHVLNTIREAASEKGFMALAIDAHNSLKSQTSITPSQASDLTQAALKALNTVSQLPQLPFKVGMSEDSLEEYSLEDGVGPGGLSMAVVKVEDQLVSYMTVDGNNMQTGLREVIIGLQRGSGVSDGEVMTTDTHLVTGLVRSPLGYHPVGDGINRTLFLRKVEEVLARTVDDLEVSSVGFASFKKSLRMLGSNTFSSITSFISTVAKRIIRSLFILELVNLAVALVFLAAL